eukprot:3425577-Ditylum_brightwellii.AAC.1
MGGRRAATFAGKRAREARFRQEAGGRYRPPKGMALVLPAHSTPPPPLRPIHLCHRSRSRDMLCWRRSEIRDPTVACEVCRSRE